MAQVLGLHLDHQCASRLAPADPAMARFVLRSSAVVALMPCVLSTEPAPSSLRGFGHGVSQLVELTGPKPLDTPEKFLGQLSWNAQSSHVACRDDEYEIPGTLFGLIKHMDGNDDTNFYATDKAVAWASGSIGLTKDLQDCCGKEKKQCLCNIAKNVGLLDPNNNNLVTGPGNYSFIAFTSVDYSVVSPTWAELAKVLPNTTDWVFNDMKLTPEVRGSCTIRRPVAWRPRCRPCRISAGNMSSAQKTPTTMWSTPTCPSTPVTACARMTIVAIAPLSTSAATAARKLATPRSSCARGRMATRWDT